MVCIVCGDSVTGASGRGCVRLGMLRRTSHTRMKAVKLASSTSASRLGSKRYMELPDSSPALATLPHLYHNFSSVPWRSILEEDKSMLPSNHYSTSEVSSHPCCPC